MIKLNLQMFAEGEAPAGAMDGGAAGSAAGNGTGGQENQTQAMTPFQQMIQEGPGKAEFEQAVGQRVQEALKERFKNQADYKRQVQSYAPIMQELGRRYQMDARDTAGIYAKMTDDLSLYQQEADQKGMTPEAVRTMHRLQAEADQAKAQAQMATERAQMENHFRGLAMQAEELKQTFPSFDLMQEMANPRFVRMTSPQGGLSVKDAFYAIHGEEIQRQTMQYTAQQAGQRIAASVQAGASRPMENGQRRQGPVNAQPVDIGKMDKKTRAKYMERIRAGEEINFVDKY